MANSIGQLKNGITDVIYAFTNDSATPVNFTVNLTDLTRNDQAIVGTPSANLSNMSFNVDAGSSIKILRNSVLLYHLTGTGEHTAAYCNDSRNNTSAITVTMGAGTLILRILKGTEYTQSA